jgi:hypothetical protein
MHAQARMRIYARFSLTKQKTELEWTCNSRIITYKDSLLNYFHSRNPTYIRAHTHIHIQLLREPLSSRVRWRVRTLSQDRT